MHVTIYMQDNMLRETVQKCCARQSLYRSQRKDEVQVLYHLYFYTCHVS